MIVLTGENPNVFYEAGRRHETGKPFIQLIKRSERIPFDVAGIRTIIYDNIESLSSAAKTIAEIQKYIEEFEKSGYGTTGTGVSMSTIAATLDRIERKVGGLMSGMLPQTSMTLSGTASVSGDVGYVRNPREAFIAAVAQGNVQRAASLLPRLESLFGPSVELISAAGYLADIGYEPAAELILRLLVDNFDELREERNDLRGFKIGIGSLNAFFSITDRESEGLSRIEAIINNLLSLSDITNEDRSFFLNQLQIILYGAKEYERALEIIEEVMELLPMEPAYVYNASLIYEKIGLSQKSIEMVDKYMSMDSENAQHLDRAVDVYVAANRIADAKKAFTILQRVDPEKAAVTAFDPKNRRALGLG